MEENKGNKMSAFCEELMEKIEKMDKKPSENDFAMLICGDGNTCATRFNGSRFECAVALSRIMKENESFAEVVMLAVDSFLCSKAQSVAHVPEPPLDGVVEVPLNPDMENGSDTN